MLVTRCVKFFKWYLTVATCVMGMAASAVTITDEDGNELERIENPSRALAAGSYTLTPIPTDFTTPTGEKVCQSTTLFGSCTAFSINLDGVPVAYLGRNDNGLIGGYFKSCMNENAFLDKIALPQLDRMVNVSAAERHWVTCNLAYQGNLLNAGTAPSIRGTLTIEEALAAMLGQTCLGLNELYRNLAIGCDQTSSGQAMNVGLIVGGVIAFIGLATVITLCVNGNHDDGAACCECCSYCALGLCSAIASNQKKETKPGEHRHQCRHKDVEAGE